MKAHLLSGQVKIQPENKEIADFMWVTKSEMPQFVRAEFWKTVEPML